MIETLISMHDFNFYGNIRFSERGCLYFCDSQTLVVSDLHLGKSITMAQRGQLLPPYDTEDTLARLEQQIGIYRPARIIALGDSFDSVYSIDSLSNEMLKKMTELATNYEFIWITGNHDANLSTETVDNIQDNFVEKGLIFRHIAEDPVPPGYFEISGHFHPKATNRARGRRITRPCFIRDHKRLIMPAFGAYTGGLDIDDQAIQNLLGDEQNITICGRSCTHHQTRIRETS